MRTIFKISLICCVTGTTAFAQNVAINASGASANASAMLDISSGSGNNRGLLIPRVTSAQKTAMNPLPAAAQGLVVYQTDGVQGFYYNTSTTTTPSWSYLSTSLSDWSLTGNSGTTAGTNFIGTTDAADWVIKTNNTERARVLSGGNFGIGTTAPAQLLDVQGGNARINNAFIGDMGFGSGWGGISHSSMNSTTGYAMIESSDGSYTLINKQNTGTGWIGFRVANSDVAVITNSGNMGIGTTSPSYRLDLGNGTFGFGSSNQRTETRNDAGLQGSAGAQSGFFETSAPSPAADWPTSASSWWHLIDCRHSNTANNYALQIAGSFFDQNLYFRKTNGSATTAWNQILTTATSITQGMTQSSATAETLITGNNTGSYTNGAGAGYTPGTYISVPGLSTTRTVTTGNVVKVSFTAAWEYNEWSSYAPQQVWFRILRDGSAIATSIAYFEPFDWYIGDGNISINIQDTGVTAGSHTYTVDCWLANTYNTNTETMYIGERYLTVTEIKP
jgi:hypothetical protein